MSEGFWTCTAPETEEPTDVLNPEETPEPEPEEPQEPEAIPEPEEPQEPEEIPGPEETPEPEALPDAEIPTDVQAFLDAVAEIPADIDAENVEEAGELVNAAFDAYEALIDAGLNEYDGVEDALATVEAAYAAINEALDMEASTYAVGRPISGDYGGFVYEPRGEFTATDGTPICVEKWDFDNIKHPYEYYKYLKYLYDNGSTQYAEYLSYVSEADSSCFERCQNFTDRGSFMPQVLGPRTVEAGKTAVFGYLLTTTDHQMNIGSQVPSVYLYDVVDVTEGEEYIQGGREALHFYASEEKGLQGIWPDLNPNNPHIRMDAPISADAPNGATIEIRFRLAYGFEAAWWGNPQGYKQSIGKGDPHREDNYYWYVEDFVYTMVVGDPQETGIAANHDLYIPAGYSTTISLSKAYDSLHKKPYTLSNASFEQGNEDVARITENELVDEYQMTWAKRIYDNVTIQAADTAQPGDTTKLYVRYHGTYSRYAEDFTDIITVHIVDPQEVNLSLTGTERSRTILRQGNSLDGTLSSSDIVFRGQEDGQPLTARYDEQISAKCLTATRNSYNEAISLTAKAEGSAVIEHHYHYYDEKSASQTVYYDDLTTYVDAIHVTVGSPQTDDPNSIDGLDIQKEADKMNVSGGEDITFILTVTNDSSIAKTVTVTDPLPFGVTFKSFDPANSSAVLEDDGFTVTWKPTVPAKDKAVLKIICKVDDDIRGGYLNNVAYLVTANGEKDKATVQPTATPAPKVADVQVSKTFAGIAASEIPAGFALEYSVDGGASYTKLPNTGGDVTVSENGLTYTWTVSVPNGQTLALKESGADVTGYSRTTTANANFDVPAVMLDSNKVTGSAAENQPKQVSITNSYTKQGAPKLEITKIVDKTSVKKDGILTYTLTVTNTGNGDATNVKVTDVLPDALEYDYKSGSPTPDASDQTLTWTLGTISSQETKTITFQAKAVKTSAGVENVATVTSSEITTPVESDPAKTVVYQLDVKKSNDGFKNDPNNSSKAVVTYTVTVTNHSGFALYGAGILDTLTAKVLDSNTNKETNAVNLKLVPVSLMVNSKKVELDTTPIPVTVNGASVNRWDALGRNVEFNDDSVVTLVYNIQMENTGDNKVYVELNNTAKGGAWTIVEKAPALRMMRMAARSSDWDATGEDSNKVEGGSSSSGGFLDPSTKCPIIIQYVEENDNNIGVVELDPVKKGETYDVTETVRTHVPNGYVIISISDNKSGTVTGDVTVTVTCGKDSYGPASPTDPAKKDEGDGIPDSFQVVVNYHVIGGVWESTQTAGDLTYVYNQIGRAHV